MKKLILLLMIACGLSASAQRVMRVVGGEKGSPQSYWIDPDPNWNVKPDNNRINPMSNKAGEQQRISPLKTKTSLRNLKAAVNGYELYCPNTVYGRFTPGDNQGRGSVNPTLYAPKGVQSFFRVKLKKLDQSANLTIKIENKVKTFDDGIIWISPEECNIWDYEGNDNLEQNCYLNVETNSQSTCEFEFAAFASKEDSEPIASQSVKMMFLVNSPSISANGRVSGELNKDVPLTIQINPGDLAGIPAKLKFNLGYKDGEATITGNGFVKNENQDTWTCDISALAAQSYTLNIKATADFTANYNIELQDKDANGLSYGSGSIVIPPSYSTADSAALKGIVDANPACVDLKDFWESGAWKDNRESYGNYYAGVKWNDEKPARVISLFITDRYGGTTVTDLSKISGLTALVDLNLSNMSELKKLDLSSLHNLRNLSVYNTDLLFGDIILATDLDPNSFNFWGNSYFRNVGTPVDNNTSMAGNRTEIDLSSLLMVGKNKTVYQWYKDDRSGNREKVDMPTAPNKEGAFILTGNIGDYYLCEMNNPTYPNWTIRTVYIKISRQGVTYNQADLDGLTKIANDNPEYTKLQEFIKIKGWELENWNSYQDEIRTDWSIDAKNNARLTHLCFNIKWNNEGKQDSIKALDVTSFTELRHLECSDHTNVKTLDLSRNTKLEILCVYSLDLQKLDVSYCPNMKELAFVTLRSEEYATPRRSILNSINFTGCTQIETFKLEHADIASLNLSSLKQLTYLHIQNCPNLKADIGWNGLPKLTTLSVPFTTQFKEIVEKSLPSTVTGLFYTGSGYALPSDAILSRLTEFGVPNTVKTFDVGKMPNLRRLNLSNDSILYSGLLNYRNGIYIDGRTNVRLPEVKMDKGQYYPYLSNGDTINLSKEATFGGYSTKFIWVNMQYRTEEFEVFKAVPNFPGVFVVDSQDKAFEAPFYCLMINPLYGSGTINSWSGWTVQTGYFNINSQGSGKEYYNENDVQTLAKIVRESSSTEMAQWWSNEGWKDGSTFGDNCCVVWNKDKVRRLMEIRFFNMGKALASTLDLTKLDSLASLICPFNDIKNLKLPEYRNSLRYLELVANPLESLIVSPYLNLSGLILQATSLKNCDISMNKKLQTLNCGGTTLPVLTDKYPEMAFYGLPDGATNFDMANTPKLNVLSLGQNTQLEYASIQNSHKLDTVYCNGPQFLTVTDSVWQNTMNELSYGKALDFGKNLLVNSVTSSIQWKRNTTVIQFEPTAGKYIVTKEIMNPGDTLTAVIANSQFPGWELTMLAKVFTCDGDANLDSDVNVQDVTATVSEILKDKDLMINPFGYYEADVNRDDRIEIADVVGIVNIILNHPVTKSAVYGSTVASVVRLSTDGDGNLYMEAPVAIAGIQLTFTGIKQPVTLSGAASGFVQASSFVQDSLRQLAYSMSGQVIPAGRSLLAKLPAGAVLVDAVFSDTQAVSLKSERSGVATSIETIESDAFMHKIMNYPNPFRGTTTFRYTLDESANEASIHIYSANGSLLKILNGLPVSVGVNEYTATITLQPGVYYYRLLVKGTDETNLSKSNIFIIK